MFIGYSGIRCHVLGLPVESTSTSLLSIILQLLADTSVNPTLVCFGTVQDEEDFLSLLEVIEYRRYTKKMVLVRQSSGLGHV